MNNHRIDRDLKLEKLGVKEIEERLEVSPIVADPGSLGSGVDPGLESLRHEDGEAKYHCVIRLNPVDDALRRFELDR